MTAGLKKQVWTCDFCSTQHEYEECLLPKGWRRFSLKEESVRKYSWMGGGGIEGWDYNNMGAYDCCFECNEKIYHDMSPIRRCLNLWKRK